MKEILIKLEALYKENLPKLIENGKCVGMCWIADENLSINEAMEYRKYLKKYLKNKKIKVFYDSDGFRTDDKDQFIWNPKDPQPRLDWLAKHIELNS